jgi:hypothetical protein
MRSQVSRRGSRDINGRKTGYYRRGRIVTIRIVCIVFFSRYNPDLVWALGFGFGFIFGSGGAWDSGLDGGVAKAVCVCCVPICIVLEWMAIRRSGNVTWWGTSTRP